MVKVFPFDFIQIDAKPNIHLFRNGSRGSCCGNVHLKDFIGGPNLKKIKTEFTFSEARQYAAKLQESEEYLQAGADICASCINALDRLDQEYQQIHLYN